MQEIGRILKKNTEINGRSSHKDEQDNSIFADFVDSAESPLKIEAEMKTSTPVKDAVGDNSISTKKLDEWFLDQER